jgi:peptidoglycan/xylan/chitin deacetylase (PgdA/CDA1 family)
MSPEEYVTNHEKFIEADLVETAVVQYTHDGLLRHYYQGLIDYMKMSPNWDIQLHGWAHDDYSKLPRWRIDEDIRNAISKSEELFGIKPTVWYPPWNCYSEDMKWVANKYNLIIDNESYDISKFIREVKAGTYTGHSVYFHLWSKDEREKIPEMIECVKKLK